MSTGSILEEEEGSAMALPAFALKSNLRKSMLRTLRAIPNDEVEQQCERFLPQARPTMPREADQYDAAQAVARLVLEQPRFSKAKSVACYLSMARGELRTTGIVDELLKRGEPTPAFPSQRFSELP